MPLLRRVCGESYTDPEELYAMLKRRGMDLVTVTDHDSIAAAEHLRRYPDFFTSVEVTCTLPAGTELHAGVYDISEKQFVEIDRRRRDFASFFAYVREQGLLCTANHLFSAITGRRVAADWPHIARFRAAEAHNGAVPSFSNRQARAWASSRGLATIAGSDAHTLRSAGRTFTAVPGARNKREFLDGIHRQRSELHGEHGAWWKLTADVVEIGRGMLKEHWRTAPIALLSPLAPIFTLVAQTRDVAYAARYTRDFRQWSDAEWSETGLAPASSL